MPDSLEMWIYRDGRERRSGPRVLAELLRLVDAMGRATGEHERRIAVDALVACGELEAALADASEPAARALAAETDILAAAALGARCDARASSRRLCTVVVPAHVTICVAEGFAYYGLHPEAYARAACNLRVRAGAGVLVVGVRSIGTTLSAIACAALTARGEPSTRFTVRPAGDAFDRNVALDALQRLTVEQARDRGAAVLVVDEGPGISGSTFLATAEALVAAGTPADRITLVCSHSPSVESLAARDAVARFRRYRVVVAASDVRVPAAEVDLSAGAWRARAYAHRAEEDWPASFTQTERRKLLLPDDRLAKFEGLGRPGRAAAARAAALAGAGLSAGPRDEGDGWLSYAWEGTPLSRVDLDAEVIDRLATYCAVRPLLCPATRPGADLEAMVAKNLEVGLGCVRPASPAPPLAIERLAVVDGRMSPHEWLRRRDGTLSKGDAVAHGDDHFFPGPTDIAWDLAGAIVEWRLDLAARERLLDTYERASGDDPRARLAAWLSAYAAFRLAFATVGMNAARGTSEEARLARDVVQYRAYAARPDSPPLASSR